MQLCRMLEAYSWNNKVFGEEQKRMEREGSFANYPTVSMKREF